MLKCQQTLISTHTPLAGRNAGTYIAAEVDTSFLLTRPSRGATCNPFAGGNCAYYFYSHAPRGAQRIYPCINRLLLLISTHTPLAGRNVVFFYRTLLYVYFYSHAPRGAQPSYFAWHSRLTLFLLTRPSRGATLPTQYSYALFPISTHTPLAGRNIFNTAT